MHKHTVNSDINPVNTRRNHDKRIFFFFLSLPSNAPFYPSPIVPEKESIIKAPGHINGIKDIVNGTKHKLLKCNTKNFGHLSTEWPKHEVLFVFFFFFPPPIIILLFISTILIIGSFGLCLFS